MSEPAEMTAGSSTSELSWLAFNQRSSRKLPMYRFHCSSVSDSPPLRRPNLDEFFMLRVAGLKRGRRR